MAFPPRHAPRILLYVLLGALVIVFLIGILSSIGTHGTSPALWYRLGAVQVFESSDEIWIFAQVDRVAVNPDRLASPTHIHGTPFQTLIRMNGERIIQRRRFRPVSTLNWRIGAIFRFGDRFYLWRDPVAGDQTLFEWNGTEFVRASDGSISDIVELVGSGEPSATQVYERLDELSRENGFRRIAAVTKHDLALDVVSTRHSIRVYADGDPLARGGQNLVVASTSDARPWTKTLIDVQKLNNDK